MELHLLSDSAVSAVCHGYTFFSSYCCLNSPPRSRRTENGRSQDASPWMVRRLSADSLLSILPSVLYHSETSEMLFYVVLLAVARVCLRRLITASTSESYALTRHTSRQRSCSLHIPNYRRRSYEVQSRYVTSSVDRRNKNIA